MATAKEILIAARKKIEDPATWTQGKSVREMKGKPTRYCSYGAIALCADIDTEYNRFNEAYALLWNAVQGSVVQYNNTHTHAEVLAMFDKAIANAD